MKLVSIIVAVYNIDKYLKECLTSLVNQDYENIEILVVNDGSTDRSQEIIDEFTNQYNNVISYQKINGGVSSSRNLGLKCAKGDYIFFVDGDDVVKNNMISNLVNRMETDHTDLVCCGYYYWYTDGTREADFPKEDRLSSDVAKSLLFLEGSLKGVVWNKLYKKSIIDTYQLSFDEEIKIGEDIVFTVGYLDKLKEISLIHQPLYLYRMRKSSALNYLNEKDLSLFEAIYQIYKIDPKMEIKMEEYYATMYFKYYQLLKKTKKIEEVKRLSFIKTIFNPKISIQSKKYIVAYMILPELIKKYMKNRKKSKDHFFE